MKNKISDPQRLFQEFMSERNKIPLKVFAIAGPNGAGKTTLIQGLLEKFPKKFHEVPQLTTRPLRAGDRKRKFVAEKDFHHEKIVLGSTAGIYKYGYCLSDLCDAVKSRKILMFEGISRLEKLKFICKKSEILSIIVGILPPGSNLAEMLSELKERLSKRPNANRKDVEIKLVAAENRIIPEVMKKSDIIIRSSGNRTPVDIENVMKKWKQICSRGLQYR